MSEIDAHEGKALDLTAIGSEYTVELELGRPDRQELEARLRRASRPAAAADPLPAYQLRQGRGSTEWVLLRENSDSELLVADGKQRAIGRSTALLRGTGGGSILVLNEDGKVESTVDVRPAGPSLGGFMVSETPVKEPA